MTPHDFDLSKPPRECVCARCGVRLLAIRADRPCGFSSARELAVAKRNAHKVERAKAIREKLPPPPRPPTPTPVQKRAKAMDRAPVPSWWDVSRLERLRRGLRLVRGAGQQSSAERVSHAGARGTWIEWSLVTGIPKETLYMRAHNGWTVAETLRVPKAKRAKVTHISKRLFYGKHVSDKTP